MRLENGRRHLRENGSGLRRRCLHYFHQHSRPCRDRENAVVTRRPNNALHVLARRVGCHLRGMRHRRQRDHLLASGTIHGNIQVRLCRCGYMVEWLHCTTYAASACAK